MTDSELIGKLNEFFKRQRCYTAKVFTERREELYWARHSTGWRLCLHRGKLEALEECTLPQRIAGLKAVPVLYKVARQAFEDLQKESGEVIANVTAWLMVEEASSPILIGKPLEE